MSQSTRDAASTSTVTATKTEEKREETLTLHLTTSAPPTGPRVSWASETVDNEGMGKRKSKCCCIYKKKRAWNDDASSDESDCETGSCRGHVEKRLENHHHDHGEG
ncbi:hypothetical protein PMAYCL1PPCAC_06239, partial [Pristionchus mayeri]